MFVRRDSSSVRIESYGLRLSPRHVSLPGRQLRVARICVSIGTAMHALEESDTASAMHVRLPSTIKVRPIEHG